MNKGAAPVTLYPYALISRHGTPETLGYYILHEGLIGVLGDQGLKEVTYNDDRGEEGRSPSRRPTPGSASPTSTGRRRCCPTPRRAIQARFSLRPDRHAEDLPDRLSRSTRRPSRRARPRDRQHAAVRRRQGGATTDRRLQQGAQAQPLRSADRLGLVLLHHQADVHRDRLVLPAASAISASPS